MHSSEPRPLHSLLKRQLRRQGKDPRKLDRDLQELIDTINLAYHEADEDRAMLERALDLSSQELLRANADLIAEKERLTVTLYSIGEGVLTTDIDGMITLINRCAEQLTGWPQEQAIGRSIDEVFQVEDEHSGDPSISPMALIRDPPKGEQDLRSGILQGRQGDGRPISYVVAAIRDRHSEVIGMVVAFRDVSEERRLEEDRLRASRLESVGLLAGGIAHDFNNILTILVGNLSLAQTLLPVGSEAGKILNEALRAGMRAKDLTQQLLTFSKGGAPVRSTAAIDELIRECARFALLGSNVRCELDIAPDLLHVEIDRGQITQVINNLIINATQAMPQGGKLIIRAENITAEAITEASMPDDFYVKISVQDEGIGIPEKHIDKIFDPYFTTKQKGSGLGLATSYSVIKNHDGRLSVESEIGVGTTFHIYLPASKHQPEDRQPEASGSLATGGKGSLLVMDDEEAILSVVQKMLQFLGYNVETARHGDEAIACYRQAASNGHPFDAVIVDLTIPGAMGGRETAARLLKIDPALKIIASSGYSNDPILADHEPFGFRAVLTKPYDLGQLSRVLTQVLGN